MNWELGIGIGIGRRAFCATPRAIHLEKSGNSPHNVIMSGARFLLLGVSQYLSN